MMKLLLQRLEEINDLMDRGFISVEHMTIYSRSPKSWIVRFDGLLGFSGKVIGIEKQRGGERSWKDPRLMFDFLYQSWGFSHAKIQLEWKSGDSNENEKAI